MTLRRKTLSMVGFILLGLIAALYFTSRRILLGSFASLEENDTRQNVERARDALAAQAGSIDNKLSDWSDWDDSYRFIEDENREYIESNLNDKTMAGLRLNFMVFLNRSGRIVFRNGFDLTANISIPSPAGLLNQLSPGAPLLRPGEEGQPRHGVLLLPEQPILLAVHPILRSSGEGPSRGTMIFGVFLDASFLSRLSEITHLSISMRPFAEESLPRDFQQARSAFAAGDRIVVHPLDEDRIAGFALIRDMFQQPCLILKVECDRGIYRHGLASLRYFMFALLFAGFVFGAGSLLLLEKSILARLGRLAKSVGRIGAVSDFSIRVPVEGRDEIAELATTVNETLENLEKSHSLLQATFDSTAEGILTLDRSLRISRLNRQFIRLWELPDDFMSRSDFGKILLLVRRLTDPSLFLSRQRYWRAHPTESGWDVYVLKSGRTLECYTVPQLLAYIPIGRIWDCRDITMHKRAEAVLQRQLEEESTLRAIAIAGSEATGVDALVELATRIIGETLYPSEIVNVALLDELTGDLLVHQPHPTPDVEMVKISRIPADQGISGQVMATGKAIRVSDVSEYPGFLRIYPDTLSELCVPLQTPNRIIGVINVESIRPNAFQENDERLLLTLAGQLTMALEKVRMFAEIQRLAITDSLTGLYNRRYFFAAAQREQERARRYKRPLSVIMMDVDHFKQVNDTHGHAAGDLVLQSVAHKCKSNLRETDILGRYGGEEFVALLPETQSAGASQVAERLREEIACTQVEVPAGPIVCTISIGVAALEDGCGATLEQLLGWADSALYEAKNSGRNRTVAWKESKAVGEKA